MGRTTFTAAEIEQLRALVREKQTADRSRQKALRARMRRLGFYITDFADYSGFTVSDLDALIQRGTITIAEDAAQPTEHGAASGPGASPDPDEEKRTESDGLRWYGELRERYRPQRLRILLIGESPPDPGDSERRFFYSPRLTYDNLYRGVAQAVYGNRDDVDIRDKPRVLELLRDDGFWLIDAADDPINKATPSRRSESIRSAVPGLVARCRTLAPELGVIICHGAVYDLTATPLRVGGVRVLHEDALPFPLGNWRAQFVAGFRAALSSAAE